MADEPLPDLSSLDRYAPVYTPAWLLAINHAPGTFVPQLENAVVDYEAYSASLFPTPMWRRMDQERTINQRSLQAGRTKTAVVKASLLPAALEIVNPHTKKYAAISPPTAAPTPKDVPAEVIPALAPISYGAHFLPMLGLEYSARTRSLFAARLYNVPLLYIPPLPDDNAYSPVLWKFEAKSIREGHPPVDLGDAVLLRQLRPEEKGWQGLIFVACVWGLNRAKGTSDCPGRELMGQARLWCGVMHSVDTSRPCRSTWFGKRKVRPAYPSPSSDQTRQIDSSTR